MKKLFTLLLTATLFTACNNTNKSDGEAHAAMIESVKSDPINVMWQDISSWNSTTASKIASYNPDKFIINVDGPGSSTTDTNCGPHIKDLIPFIDTLVNVFGYKGILAMHPDCSKGDYGHDWMGKGNLPNIDSLGTESYKVYVDYFKEMNDSLTKAGLPTFTELLLETENSYIASSKAKFQKPLFDKVRSYMNDSTIKLSATSDWEGVGYINWGIDLYYIQMYDMSWVDTCRSSCSSNGLNTHLSGPNKYSTTRITELVKDMDIVLNHWKFPITDSVCFTFTYAKGKTPHVDAPMFGEDSLYWTEPQFNEFIEAFRNKTNCSSVGIWRCSSPFEKW
jgi:hypothetical protein